MRRLALLQAIHLNSQRVPHKLLEPIGCQTLLQIGLGKLQQLQQATGVHVLMAVSYQDQALCDLVDASGVERIEIGKVASVADGYSNVFTDWTQAMPQRFDWVIDANVVCRPFLRAETLGALVQRATDAHQPFVATVEERGLIWNDNAELVVGAGQVADTKNNPAYHRLAHLGYAHPADLWEERALSAASQPLAFTLLPEERIDIDTPEDLEFARIVYRGMNSDEE